MHSTLPAKRCADEVTRAADFISGNCFVMYLGILPRIQACHHVLRVYNKEAS